MFRKLIPLLLLCATSLRAQTFTLQPVAETVQAGAAATFTATVTGGPCRSLWVIGGTGHYGQVASSFTYTFPSAALTQSGTTVQVQVYGCASGAGGTSFSSTVKLTVVPTIILESLAVSPVAPTIGIGQTQAFTVAGTYSDGSTQDLTSMATWTSESPAMASVSSGGSATGLALGSSIIQASVGATLGSTILTVEPLIQINLSALYNDVPATQVPLILVVSQVVVASDGTITSTNGVAQIIGSGSTSMLLDPGFTYQIAFILSGVPAPFLFPTYYPASLVLATMPNIKTVYFNVVLDKATGLFVVKYDTGAS
jgi:hypothetical protein